MQIQTTTGTMAPAPGSPTLTNPDMILPYGEYDSTPSPPQHPYRPLSPEIGDMQFSIGSAHSHLNTNVATTPIIYGNGTMLSDIGEVTEAESTVGRSRRLPGPAERRLLKQRQNSSPIGSSPTMGYEALRKRTKTGSHQRHVSVESASTVTSEGQAAEMFKDFDDSVSVDDTNFQGDDEESMAGSYAEDFETNESRRLSRIEEAMDGDDDRNSSAALSKRAEQILLNAKKRLNNMEGNLSRARSSLFTTANSSGSSIHSSSPLSRQTPSPPTNGRRLYPQQKHSPSIHRQVNPMADSGYSSPGHSRVYSENSIVPPVPTSPTLARSASAAARYVGEAIYSPENGHKDRAASAFSRPSPPLRITLQPLDEDEASPEFESGRGKESFEIDGGRISPGINPHGLTRSTSSMQMRDLQDQMQGLKGRLSVLRDRTRSDMKRRSLQSLRTPSPFTAAEQWYAGAKGYGEGNLSADAVVPIPPWNQAPTDEDYHNGTTVTNPTADTHQIKYPESDMTSIYEDVSEGRSLVNGSAQQDIDAEDDADERDEEEEATGHYETVGATEYADDKFVDDDENGEIEDHDAKDYESDTSHYHDTYTTPISHEDREDAFDYEHFFLHSAMGTISQQRHGRRDSVGSFNSEDSVETTRGPDPSIDHQAARDDPRTSMGHFRSESNASVSTLATFATATEGLGSDGEDDDDHDNFAVRQISHPERRSSSPESAAKRSTFGSLMKNGIPNDRQPTPDEFQRRGSVIHIDSAKNGHMRHQLKPSFESQTSPRSFPLVNRSKTNSMATSNDLRNGQLFFFPEKENGTRVQPSPVHMLGHDDQILVEKLVASVGKCVLGLQEAGESNYDARQWRRRLDAARRILEGNDGAI